MAVKASVSISEQQDEYARALVQEGRYASLSAVVQRGLELVREEHDMKDAEIEAMRLLLSERSKGPFIGMKESRKRLDDMIARKRTEREL